MNIKTIINPNVIKSLQKKKWHSGFFNLPLVLTLLLAVFFTQCKKDDFEGETKGICPEVLSVDPSQGDSAVHTNKTINVVFNVNMDSTTINNGSFLLHEGTNQISGIVTAQGNSASFNPVLPLEENTVYTGTITTETRDPHGNFLPENFVWSFTTGMNPVTPPTVISTDPVHNATNVALNKTVTATFNEAMNPATINNLTFTLTEGMNSIAGVVSYSGTTASFNPTSNLELGKTYTATITTGAQNGSGTSMANNYIWTFSTGAVVAPIVMSTDPAHNATNVPLNKTITATFSQPMNPATITNATFTLREGTNSITGAVSYSGTTASFDPNVNLQAGKTYTATITTGAQNGSGTGLANNYVWTFSTGAVVAPIVISTDPANNATNVALNKIVTATFSQPMNPSTINNVTFTLKEGTNNITGAVSYSGTTASFDPTLDLQAGKTYTATITTGAQNGPGTGLASNYVWTFSTAAAIAPTVISTDPMNNASNVALNKTVTATFSEAMNPATISNVTFTLKEGTNNILGVVSYSGTTASFNPTNDLVSGKTYTATITTGAQNMASTGLANNHVWTFSTSAPAPGPVVNLKSAADFGILAGTGVSNNAGFSEIRNMNVGISPGVRSSITGFPPAIVVNGAIYASDDIAPPGVAAMLTDAKQDLTDAYLFAEGATTPAPASVSGDLGGTTLAPGIYKTTSTLMIQSGDLTLDAQGDPNATWIFQIAAGFTTVGGAGGNVILSGGAQAKNVFWQVGSSATIGDNTSFKGNILALTSITMNSGAVAEGRMLAINGAVVMTNTNIINKP